MLAQRFAGLLSTVTTNEALGKPQQPCETLLAHRQALKAAH